MVIEQVRRHQPLLDGQHTAEEIEQNVPHLFATQQLGQCLELLASQNLLEHDVPTEVTPTAAEPLVPQLNFLHELGANPHEVQKRLSCATVTVVGLGGGGAETAISLAAIRVGRVRCVDSSAVTATDTYLSPMFFFNELGTPRAEVVAKRIEDCSKETKAVVRTETLNEDSDVMAAVERSDFVVRCLDSVVSENSIALKTRGLWCRVSGTLCQR